MRFLPKSRRSWAATILVSVIASPLAWYAAAYPRGMLMARIDHARGHYEVKVYGGPVHVLEIMEMSNRLRQRYGVQVNWITDHDSTGTLACYAEGYNSVSERLLIAKHGKDIFAECEDAAPVGWPKQSEASP